MKSEWKKDGHTLRFVIEDGELVECVCEHLQDCMGASADWPYDQPDPKKCDIAWEEEWEPLGEDNADDRTPLPWKDRADGVYKVDIEHYYNYCPPTYPDYEADSEFAWRPYGEVRVVPLYE
jgi:hypothetical protein